MADRPEHERLESLYVAFNARDVDAVLAAMTDDVDWPNAWQGGRLAGTATVRTYWLEQWAAIDPTVEPVAYVDVPSGAVEVRVAQTVRDLDGNLVGSGEVLHTYTFRDGLVARMDVTEPAA